MKNQEINKIMKIKNIFRKGAGSVCCGFAVAFMALPMMTSCADFFEPEAEDVIFTDKDHLTNWTDTVYSLTGILNKLQVIADRTVLLGEVRGDLVDLTDAAGSDLRDLALFQEKDDNVYNSPRDYYAIINNCNYYIANAKTDMRNSQDKYVFMTEYAAIKAIRAWTYLQLVLNYGEVAYYEEPLLTKEAAEAAERAPKRDLDYICQALIADLESIPVQYRTEYPGIGNIRNTDSRFFYFPIDVVLGDLYLWSAKTPAEYYKAATCYYNFINNRNGLAASSFYPVGINVVQWPKGTTSWVSLNLLVEDFWGDERYSNNGELITMIPGDSIRAEGYYSELRNLFNSTTENLYKYSITPSNRLTELSESMVNCVLGNNGTTVSYSPSGLSERRSGDLRLAYSCVTDPNGYRDPVTGDPVSTQLIRKYNTRNVHIYRKHMVYLRMAEALNQAGFPRAAFATLSEGLDNAILRDSIGRTIPEADSIKLAAFDFPSNNYRRASANFFVTYNAEQTPNTIGVHTRGSGYTPMNEFYKLINDTVETDEAKYRKLTAEQQAYVDSLLLDEMALEFAFEGTRYYDLMRFAKRQANPGAFMKKHIEARKGKKNSAPVSRDLSDPKNWYMTWKGKLGFK